MTIWTYRESTAEKPYWQGSDTDGDLLFIEHDNGKLEWYHLTGGKMKGWDTYVWLHGDFKGKVLEHRYWPQWCLDMDDSFVDEGI